jgi:bifunctional non-homologous end joining protein LigD
MLASVGTDVPAGHGWVFEPKYDGIRILAFASGGKVTLLSRNGLDKTKQFPEVADSLAALHTRAKRPFIVDGEIVAMQDGSPRRFQALQGRMHVTDSFAIENHRDETPTALVVFDLLLDGKASLLDAPWRTRRKRLAALQLSDVSDDGTALLREAHAHDWEGIIAKRDDATYEPGRRTKSWLKLKIERRQEFVVGGWTEPRNSREHIGAVLLGVYHEDGKLVYAGHTGTGFDRKSLADMYQRLTRIERKTSPFSPTPRTNEAAHWARPSVVVEIKFSEWTADGKLRHPVFLGTRDDKDPRDVVHEPESIARDAEASKPPASRRARTAAVSVNASVSDQLTAIEAAGGAGTLTLPSGALEVSNLDKMFFPEVKRTKGDLLRYYALSERYQRQGVLSAEGAGRSAVQRASRVDLRRRNVDAGPTGRRRSTDASVHRATGRDLDRPLAFANAVRAVRRLCDHRSRPGAARNVSARGGDCAGGEGRPG